MLAKEFYFFHLLHKVTFSMRRHLRTQMIAFLLICPGMRRGHQAWIDSVEIRAGALKFVLGLNFSLFQLRKKQSLVEVKKSEEYKNADGTMATQTWTDLHIIIQCANNRAHAEGRRICSQSSYVSSPILWIMKNCMVYNAEIGIKVGICKTTTKCYRISICISMSR